MQIQGTITIVSLATPPNQQGLMYQNITVVDAQGNSYNGKIAFKKAAYVAQTPFNGTADPNSDGSYYFRKINPQYANQQPSQVPQQQAMPTSNIPQQGFHNPPQQTYTPVKPQRDTGTSIERQSAIKSACALLAGTNADVEEVVKTAERFTYFYESGKAPIQGDQDGLLGQPPNYDEVPD